VSDSDRYGARASGATIDEIVLADEEERWRTLGFDVADGGCQLGSVRIRLAGSGAGEGIVSWSLRGLRDGAGGKADEDDVGEGALELDGLPTSSSSTAVPEPAGEHPNGVLAIDHVVAFSPDLDRTVAALSDAGLDLRRVREEPTPAGAPRQAFFRLGAEILEVVQVPDHVLAERGGSGGPARLWGLALTVADIDRTAASLGESCSAPRDAVQPGRRIATLRRSAGLAVPVALMTPNT
jgi:hypothetical protein